MAFNAFKEGKGFAIIFEGQGIRRRVKKRSEDWKRLEFDSCKTLEEARDWCRTLTAQDKDKRTEAKRQRILVRLEEAGLKQCAWLPDAKVKDFETRLRTYKVTARHWNLAKLAILKMGVEPHKWKDYPFRFYDYCAEHAWSLDYVNTIRRTMNAWGEFYCTQGYTPIKYPTGADRTRLMLAYERFKPKKGQKPRRRPSGRLSFALLEANKAKFSEAEYRWLYVSRAFGLRPEEMNVSLRDPLKHHVSKKQTKLKIYQPKLERAMTNPLARWKSIDVVKPEQTKALTFLSQTMSQPLTMHGLQDPLGRRITPYGGRKDFYPEMAKEYGEARASKWLGHGSVDTARRHYDDPFSNAPGFDEDDAA